MCSNELQMNRTCCQGNRSHNELIGIYLIDVHNSRMPAHQLRVAYDLHLSLRSNYRDRFDWVNTNRIIW